MRVIEPCNFRRGNSIANRIFGLLAMLAGVGFFNACASRYHIENVQSRPGRHAPYATYMVVSSATESAKQKVVQSIISGFAIKLETIAFTVDSINPQLLFLIRWEEHLVGRVSSNTNNEVMPTYSITNPVYSPFENTSDRLTSNASAPQRIRYYDKESFIRIQAIDAIRNELIWSIKIYPHKKNELRLEHVPQLVNDIAHSFSQVQHSSLDSDQP